MTTMWTETQVVAEVDRITLRRLRLWVRNGWVVPATSTSGPRFDDLDVERVRLVCELKEEMNLNDDAVPVVLSLLDQLYGMRREFKALTQALDEQPQKVRQTVRETYQRLLGA